MTSHEEIIECPNFETAQFGTVQHTNPFWTYFKECIKCNYFIMESDWNEINPEKNDHVSKNQ